MIVGLTGGIGSGKTTIAGFFKELGVPVYHSDDEAKKLMHTPAVREKVEKLFGSQAYINDILNRKFISDQVFENKDLLYRLNAIVHPAVRKNFEEWVAAQNAKYVIQEVAILFENDLQKKFDFTILVTAPEDTRIERVMKRENVKKSAVLARIANQWSDEKKRPLADFIIENITLENSRKKVEEINVKILSRRINT